MKKTLLAAALAVTPLFLAGQAMAAPVIVNSSLGNIGSAFDNIITGTGSTVTTAQVVNGQSVYNYVDKDGNAATVSVTRTSNGAAANPSGGLQLWRSVAFGRCVEHQSLGLTSWRWRGGSGQYSRLQQRSDLHLLVRRQCLWF